MAPPCWGMDAVKGFLAIPLGKYSYPCFAGEDTKAKQDQRPSPKVARPAAEFCSRQASAFSPSQPTCQALPRRWLCPWRCPVLVLHHVKLPTASVCPPAAPYPPWLACTPAPQLPSLTHGFTRCPRFLPLLLISDSWVPTVK